MNKENKNSKSNSKNNKKTKKVTETETKSKDTNKNKTNKKEEKKVEKKIIEEAIIENDELEIDEELEMEFEDDEFETNEIEVEEVKPTPKKSKTKKEEKTSKETKKEEKSSKVKEEKVSKDNIKKIEKIAKSKKQNTKKESNTITAIGNFLEENRNIILEFIAGMLLTILVVIIIWPDRIATLKDGTQPIVKVAGKTYTADSLYERMKSHYSVSQLLDQIDTDILTKKYKETDEMLEEVNSNAEYYLNMYKQYYGYTQEEFLSANGFNSYDAYLEYLKLDYRRKKYLDEYVESNLKDDEIQKYYDENVYGDINCQHILVEVSDNEDEGLNDEDAKKLAEEIIDKINDGTSWDDIQKEYKDKITFEDLKYQSWDSELEDSFKTALKEMSDDSYSEEPVKTSYGYHVIHRLDQKDAPSLKKTKSTIIEKLVEEKESDDENLQYKALINLREEKNIKFSDTDMKAKYEAYKKQYK